MKSKSFIRTKRACYYASLAMSSVFSLPPLLFSTFQEMYGISYTLLGTLVLVNFCTQLAIDLIFTFFTRCFNIQKTIRAMPLLTSAGLFVYAFVPLLAPQYAYAGFLTGTVIFSVAAGLCEVLLSPLVAAIPSDTPERDMSFLHSLYAYGVLGVTVVSTVFLRLAGTEHWMYLTMFWALLPILSCALFCLSPMPEIRIVHGEDSAGTRNRRFGLMLCVMGIFLGSAAENVMTNWISVYMENALRISKVVGDVLGMALFAVLLGLGRSAYAKYGKNISKVLLGGMLGAAVCYLVASLSSVPVISMSACVLTGLCVSMLWPGTLILMEEKYPNAGIAAYALMAAGGDFGGSVAPQLMGVVVDAASASEWAARVGEALSLTPEQIGIRTGMLAAAVFPVLGVFLLIFSRRFFRKTAALQNVPTKGA